MSEDLLDNFLSLAAVELKESTPKKRELKDANIFVEECSTPQNLKENHQHAQNNKTPGKTSVIHSGDTDSSDDEDNKYYEDQKYNQFGRDIKHLLKSPPLGSNTSQVSDTWKTKINNSPSAPRTKPLTKAENVQADPVFGLRIVNPLVSFTTLQEKMLGREAVAFSRIKTYVKGNLSDKNWVIAGVIVSKSAVRTSQKGNQFLIWSLSDLKYDIKTVSVFLFRSAYSQLWKTPTGTVVGILNASVLDKKDGSKDEATLSVDNAQKIMILGQSKDLGRCKSVKKSGEQCNAIVNINNCEFCIYHIKQEYQKCSKRSELQSNFAGKGLTALRNKVLGKNEVFYGGQLYTAIPAKRNKKLEARDDSRLQALNGAGLSGILKEKKIQKKSVSKAAANIEVTHQQRLRDLTLLERLGGGEAKSTFSASHSSEATFETSKQAVANVLAKLKENGVKSTFSTSNSSEATFETSKQAAANVLAKLKENGANKETNSEINKIDTENKSRTDLSVMNVPRLSDGGKGIIDLNCKITTKHVSKAKLNALKYIQRNGPLKKSDPNSVKKSDENRKRLFENVQSEETSAKKQKIEANEFLSDRFKKMMEAASKHTDLLDARDDEEQEKYFHKLEVKEKMEEKMATTYKVACKAVRCMQCKYTNFSASQFCKDNKHPLRVYDAMKRFFKCGNCGNRTQSLEIVPTTACNNCGSGKWERTGMMKEKVVGVAHTLSIRGGEQKFVNSIVTDTHLDLLVPDEIAIN